MNPADALTWIIGLGALGGLVQHVRHFGLKSRGWLFVQSIILVLVALSVTLDRSELTYAATATWALFVLGPVLSRRRERELLERYRFDDAARFARLTALLHPFDDFPSRPTLLLAQGATLRGEHERARELLTKLEGSPRMRELAELELLRLDHDWRRLVERVEARANGELDPSFIMPYFRALAELGDATRLLTAYAKLPAPYRRLATVRLVVVAFSGRPDLVQALFDGPLAREPVEARSLWLAIAEQAAGDRPEAARRLEALRDAEILADQARQRLVTPAPFVDPKALSPEAERALADLAREMYEARAARGGTTVRRRPIATSALIGALAIVFAVGAYLGGNDGPTLIRLGALVLPAELVDGAWWRVVTAGFLHVNETHLVMNALGLWVLGRPIEQRAGPFALFIAFLGASVGAYTTGLFFMRADVNHPAIALGASAGVLGLVGAIASFAGAGYFLRKNRLLGRQLAGVGVIVAIQLVFDAYHPGVSSFLHLAGAAWGAVIALPYSLRHFRRTTSAGGKTRAPERSA